MALSPLTLEESLASALRTALDGARGALVLAVSGGSDSVALCELVATLGWPHPLAIAHYDHRVRPDSAADAAWVAELGARCGFETIVGVAPPAGATRRREAELRTMRYAFLADVCAARGATLLTGHTQDDVVETLLLQLLRGGEAPALAGLAPRRTLHAPSGAAVDLVRPLWGVRRADLRDFLLARGARWRDDPTNHDGSNRRGRVRHELMPLLTAIVGADPVPALAGVAASLRGWRQALDALVPAGDDPRQVKHLPAALIDHWLRALGVRERRQRRWARARVQAGSSGTLVVSPELELVITETRVALVRRRRRAT